MGLSHSLLNRAVYDRRFAWRYFKVDALRPLRYEGYNSYADYFENKGLDHERVFRNLVQQIRDAISQDNYMMGCWGIRPELIGNKKSGSIRVISLKSSELSSAKWQITYFPDLDK